MNYPTSADRPNIVTATEAWEIFVGNRQLKEGESVMMGARECFITNIPNLKAYNWVACRVIPEKEASFLVEESLDHLLPGQYIERVPNTEVICKTKVRQVSTITSHWGERIIIESGLRL